MSQKRKKNSCLDVKNEHRNHVLNNYFKQDHRNFPLSSSDKRKKQKHCLIHSEHKQAKETNS